LRGSRFSTKVVPKTGPDEKMGVLANCSGAVRVIEYSEIDEAKASMREGSGRLVFWAGNMANHIVDLGFAQEVRDSGGLPIHGALKAASGAGEKAPKTVMKMETFIFDALPMDPDPLVFETRREDEFAPVKSQSGADTPQRCRAMLTMKYRGWLERAGLLTGGKGPTGGIEISPLTATGPDDLRGLDVTITPGRPILL
jgi:UDP-N-acetylglucosamine/UDP-N-acetylgalactosamine diphosphorylase